MLKACEADTLDDLYADVPASLRLKAPYALPDSKSELYILSSVYRPSSVYTLERMYTLDRM